MYSATTHEIRVTVTPEFSPEKSTPTKQHFFWHYTIEITNLGMPAVQLLTRHWRITDAHGRNSIVDGEGVVGEKPVLRAGESFTYTSGVPLATPSGFMRGEYGMCQVDGDQRFKVEIPAFSLDTPDDQPVVN
ncbi:MAG: Co2+/Mg2+ efflux protein ApaG [Rhodobiaceae bacterium]|nr:Co2+/Mg2+ efflux protein ApaG [Rhodobiaceae bacterium]MCC0054933.1 Co2+/Mg2+ efflux protein ApaG [Rhodobiaceae bacterium]